MKYQIVVERKKVKAIRISIKEGVAHVSCPYFVSDSYLKKVGTLTVEPPDFNNNSK